MPVNSGPKSRDLRHVVPLIFISSTPTMEEIFLAYAGLLTMATVSIWAGAWGSLPVSRMLFTWINRDVSSSRSRRQNRPKVTTSQPKMTTKTIRISMRGMGLFTGHYHPRTHYGEGSPRRMPTCSQLLPLVRCWDYTLYLSILERSVCSI